MTRDGDTVSVAAEMQGCFSSEGARLAVFVHLEEPGGGGRVGKNILPHLVPGVLGRGRSAGSPVLHVAGETKCPFALFDEAVCLWARNAKSLHICFDGRGLCGSLNYTCLWGKRGPTD
jgi:hypothetical protein